jgi:hypothetical protein
LKFNLSSLAAAFNEQYVSIPDGEIALMARKFCALHKFHKKRRRSLRGCFECGDTTHFTIDCPKRKKFNSSNKYDYANQNDSSNKGDNKKKNHFRDKKKKFQKIISRACAALSDFDFSSEEFSISEEGEKIKCKKGEVWSHGTRGSTGALPNGEVVSGATGYLAVPEPSSMGRQGPEP